MVIGKTPMGTFLYANYNLGFFDTDDYKNLAFQLDFKIGTYLDLNLAKNTTCLTYVHGWRYRKGSMTDKVWKIIDFKLIALASRERSIVYLRKEENLSYGLLQKVGISKVTVFWLSISRWSKPKMLNRNLCQGRFLPKVKWWKKDRNEKQRIGSITMWWEGCITASEWLSMLHSPSICILVNTCNIRKQLCNSSSITYSISLISCFVVHFFFFPLICNTNTKSEV